MPRIRSVKPEFWTDFDLASKLSRDARLLYVALWNNADEHARLPGDPRFVKGQCFPYDDDLGPVEIDALLDELVAAEKVTRYFVDGAPYLVIPSLGDHQRLEPGKVASRHPAPPDPDGPDESASRADKSAPRSDESAHGSDIHSCGEPASGASSQVRAGIGARADLSAPRADSSEPIVALQVAGSMEHGACGRQQGGRAQTTPPPLPPAVEILKTKLDARKLHVRWDRLEVDELTEIETLIETVGDAELVRSAVQSFRADSPPAFAQAWLSQWRDLARGGIRLAVGKRERCPVHDTELNLNGDCHGCVVDAKVGDR